MFLIHSLLDVLKSIFFRRWFRKDVDVVYNFIMERLSYDRHEYLITESNPDNGACWRFKYNSELSPSVIRELSKRIVDAGYDSILVFNASRISNNSGFCIILVYPVPELPSWY